MPTSFKRFVITEALGVAALNAGINAGYTSYLWRGLDPLTLFGANATGFDLAMTPIVIAVLSTMLGTSAIRQKLRDGRIEAPTIRVPASLASLPNGIVLRGLALGAVAAIALAMPLLLMLQASAMATLSLAAAVLMKVAITVPLSLLIVPVVIFAGLADVQRRASAATAERVLDNRFPAKA